MVTKIKPCVAGASGKQQLLPEIEQEINRAGDFATYYEPFVGGGAVLFDLLPQNAVVNDYNTELINVYQVIKNDVTGLISELSSFQNTKDDFYKIRAWDRDPNYLQFNPIKKAARFIYLNKTCFNGLYRVNSKGYFNTPYNNRKNTQIVNKSNLQLISNYLNANSVTLNSGDFTEVLVNIKPHSLVYFDPPYVPLNPTSNFTHYTSNGFNADDQARLADECLRLDKLGIKFILSNSDTELVHNLYNSFQIRTVLAKRYINSKGNKRNAVKEVLVTNF